MKHMWKAIGLTFGVITLGFSLLIFLLNDYYKSESLSEQSTVVIRSGASLTEIAHHLSDNKVISYPALFIVNVKFRGLGSKIQAGEYVFPAHSSPSAIVVKMVEGRTVKRKLTIVEGLTSHEIVALVNQAHGLKHNIVGIAPEGSLLPETYYYSLNDSREAIVKRMQSYMDRTLNQAWAQRRENFQLSSPKELLILASIVEKETGIASERARVAAVFVNRLRRKMPLQSDATVSYGIWKMTGTFKLELSKDDLRTITPYNTYMVNGLPPAPICNPGKASIMAVINHVTTEELYFVANGSGGHIFANTLDEHQRNHHKWRLIRQARKDSLPKDGTTMCQDIICVTGELPTEVVKN